MVNKIDSFKNRLAVAMSLSGKRAVDIVNETGIKKSAFSQYASGKIEPKTDKIFVLAKALNVQEAWLMGFDAPMERQVKRLNAEMAQEHFDLITKFDDLTAENQNMVLKMIESLLKTQ